ncbi:P1 family peptidase [Propionibacteriaceae bacterium Y1685]
MLRRPRARELGIEPGQFSPGPTNAITDVSGVRVGQTTVRDSTMINTGVTAIIAEPVLERRPVPAGLAVGNGYGKLIGATQLVELGEIETPVLLTATLSAFGVADALVSWLLERPGFESVTSINPVVGETNDGPLSDIRRRPITAAHVHAALDGASTDAPAEGCVGAGTGTSALGYKGGIGTASRVVQLDGRPVTLGALVQSNFSGTLRVQGQPVPASELITDDAEIADDGNSCMIILATDASVDARQLTRIARRGLYGMERVGADWHGNSGDYAIAFSTTTGALPPPDSTLHDLFLAAVEVVEEALLNSLFTATTTVGFTRTQHALPLTPWGGPAD